MENLNLTEIAKNNESIDVERIKEIMEYIEAMKPFIEKKGYDIGEPEINENVQMFMNSSKNNELL